MRAFEGGADSFLHPFGLITSDTYRKILNLTRESEKNVMIAAAVVPDHTLFVYSCESWEELYNLHFPYGLGMVINRNYMLTRSPDSVRALKKVCETNVKLAGQLDDWEDAVNGEILKPYPGLDLYESTKKAFEDGAKSVMHPLGLLTKDDYNRIRNEERRYDSVIQTADIPYPTWVYKYDNWDEIYGSMPPRYAADAFKYCWLSHSNDSITALKKACKNNAKLVEELKKRHVYYSVLS